MSIYTKSGFDRLKTHGFLELTRQAVRFTIADDEVIFLQKRLLAVDIDGTLVNDDKVLLPQTARDISEFMERGGVLVLATGRPTPGVRRYIDELALPTRGGYVISYNGARTFYPREARAFTEKNVPPSTYPRILDAAQKLNLPLTAYRDDVAVTEKADDRYFRMETTINGLVIDRVPSLREALTFSTPKFLITGEPAFLETAEIQLRNALKDLPVAVFRSEPCFLEITARGCDKGAAILELARLLGISPEETMACGDGYNDVTMLSAVGLGVAMANARTPAKAAADVVTLSNNENGVGAAIRRYAL